MGAAFVSQQFLQNVLGYSTLEAGRGVPAGRRLHGPRRAALGEARRGPRRALHAAARLRLPPARVPLDAPALEGGQPVLEGRARATRSSASASASPGRRHRIRSPDRCRCGARAWRREPPTCSATSAARSCSRSSARCSPPATPPLVGRRSPRSGKDVTDSVQNQLTKSFAGAEEVAAAVPAVRESDHRRGEDVVPPRRPVGVHGRDRRRPGRRGARLLRLPEEGGGGGAARPLPRRGRSAADARRVT